MTIPVLSVFNNKGGVGKTTLVYHLAWMFHELDINILAVDIDPQCNLTVMFLEEERLLNIWNAPEGKITTLFRSIEPLMNVGDIQPVELEQITQKLYLLAGELSLSTFEDELSENWPKSMDDKNLERPFKILTAFWQVIQNAAQSVNAKLIIADVGPNLGAINRSALIASDYVLIPLGADLFSLQGLRNLGPTLQHWRKSWKKRIDNWEKATIPLPKGEMQPIGYVAQQHGTRISRPVKAYNRWLNQIPNEYRINILKEQRDNSLEIENDPYCLAQLKHYRSLIPLAQEARKPIFSLKPADGAIGSHALSAQEAYIDFAQLAKKMLQNIGIT
ncbi:ParA family protein [Thioflexithrix psekupsensis]|uniref:Chromosome partitioning protein n=1 Tax=Thioflexithrix psekupsensis TaxID=1570016 RepID=A0A251XBN8_9GAMM|nr:AAA family ATPase [Thioflexithrix psekupsensis]OUD15335.1 chromosome partitioning protein [Thioflexithrix psekupsensis]